MAPAIPDRWLKYTPIGKQIDGTRLIAFKVPLRELINQGVDENLRLDANILLQEVPNLGMIIDLTNTNRYYNPDSFKEKGLEYTKIMIPGHLTPPSHLVQQFKINVLAFLNKNSDNDKLIGVHCTHGVNRTGYLICNYMISELGMQPKEAINKFALARGHKIERINYLDSLNNLTKKSEQIQITDTHHKEPISWRAACAPVLPPSPQVFDRRDRFERFREDSRRNRQRFTSSAVTAPNRSARQYSSNTFALNSRTNYKSNYRYVNPEVRDSQDGRSYSYRASEKRHDNFI